MIVWIASYPRSGNSLFRIALHRLYGVRSAPDPLRPRPADSRCARERNPKSHVRPNVFKQRSTAFRSQMCTVLRPAQVTSLRPSDVNAMRATDCLP